MLASLATSAAAQSLGHNKTQNNVQARPSIQSASRILCLRLQELSGSGFKRPEKIIPLAMISEAFLKFSPRVQMRTSVDRQDDQPTHWLFLDIASTSHFFLGEEGLMRSAASLARDLGFGVQCAIADTPAGAQAFTTARLHERTDAPEVVSRKSLPSKQTTAVSKPAAESGVLVPPGEEREWLQNLSLPHFLHLEGLEAWARPQQIENIITFFMMLGFKSIGELSRFTASSFQERWGEVGAVLWKRICAQDRQVISPLLPTEPLEDYVHLDFPVSLVSLLLRQVEKSIDFLFARLHGRQYFAKKLVLILHCEYSNRRHKIEIEPNTPNRDRNLFTTLIESRLHDLDLLNPIRDVEVKVVPCPEKSHQLNFFEPQTTDVDKTQMLFSLLSQASAPPGFYQIEPSIHPEGGWQVSQEPPRCLSEVRHHQAHEKDARAITPRPYYGESIMQAPRPTRVLKTPRVLASHEVKRMHPLSRTPIERIENGWWENGELKRDYYFAVSQKGECLWIYQDLIGGEFFLHGYFD